MTYRSAAVLSPATDWSPAVRARTRIGHAIEVHESIGSTNDRARELLAEPAGDGVVVLAESQLAGRGRRGRSWTSPPGVNLTLSVGLRCSLAAADAWQLGLATALAVLDACRDAVPPSVRLGLKWPNDLVAPDDGRKAGGLLVETVVAGDRVIAAVLGIGVNINWASSEMPPEIGAAACSLGELAGEALDRVALLDRMLDELDAEVRALDAGESPLRRYRAACVTIGTDVEVATGSTVTRGRAVEIDASGALVVEAEGRRVAVATGDVTTVRPSRAG